MFILEYAVFNLLGLAWHTLGVTAFLVDSVVTYCFISLGIL